MTRHLMSILLAFILAAFSQASAASTVDCEVTTIRASSLGRGTDPRLSAFASVLAQKPFSDFNSFEFLHKQLYKVELDTPVALQLPSGLAGSLTYRGPKDSMLALHLELYPTGKAPIRIDGAASPGAPLFAAGFKEKAGTLIFAVACRDAQLQLVQ